jgi:hypothetical protein
MSPPLSHPPAGVPQSGNAKYAIVAVLLLLAAGGIFAWRTMLNRDRTTTQVPVPVPSLTASATPPSNPRLDDVPPPPPVEVVPEAGPGPRVVYVPSGGSCDSACSTKYSTPELGQALQVRGAQARRCYNSALAGDSTLKGHVTISVRIAPNGSVCSANVSSNDMGSSAVASCAASIFRNASYPAPKGGCVEAAVPLSFVQQGQ